jgi:iron complex transport system ATP-binding protein
MPLAASNLRFEYARGRPVLNDVSAVFEPGLVHAVIGPNGAGKSTLLRLLIGAVRPAQGHVQIDGASVLGLNARERARRIAYTSQRASLAFSFAVRQVVALGRYAAGETGETAIDRALARVDLLPRADEPFGALSAGQQQRASLARALAQLDLTHPPEGTRALILDEPVAALDPRHALDVMSLLRSLASQGFCIITAIHDLSLVSRLCDRTLLLSHQGRVAAAGPTSDVLVSPKLSEVFGVQFERLPSPRGGSALLPV